MIRKKIFYSVICKDGIVGIRKQDGYQLKIGREKFNAYHSIEDGSTYIIDPQNGVALQIYDVDESEDELSEIELIEKAKEKFIQNGGVNRWKEERGNESYRLIGKMFKAYKRAESFREKQKEAAIRYSNRL